MDTMAIPSNVDIQGDAIIRGALLPPRTRSEIQQDNNAVYDIPFSEWKIFDAFATDLAATALSDDDLALVGGVHGTDAPSIQTLDVKNVTKTRKARATFTLPPEYVAGESVTLRFSAGMKTTVASVSATLDVEVFKSAKNTLKTGTDLYTGAAVTINSLVFADKDFSLVVTTLSPGDVIDILVIIATNDSATATAVIGCLGSTQVLCDIKG